MLFGLWQNAQRQMYAAGRANVRRGRCRASVERKNLFAPLRQFFLTGLKFYSCSSSIISSVTMDSGVVSVSKSR